MQDVTDVLMNSWISMKFNSVQNDTDLMYLIRMLLKGRSCTRWALVSYYN